MHQINVGQRAIELMRQLTLKGQHKESEAVFNLWEGGFTKARDIFPADDEHSRHYRDCFLIGWYGRHIQPYERFLPSTMH